MIRSSDPLVLKGVHGIEALTRAMTNMSLNRQPEQVASQLLDGAVGLEAVYADRNYRFVDDLVRKLTDLAVDAEAGATIRGAFPTVTESARYLGGRMSELTRNLHV